MNYPESLKKGDTIGICAPSGGITKIDKIKKLEEAIKQLEEMGYIKEIDTLAIVEKASKITEKKRNKLLVISFTLMIITSVLGQGLFVILFGGNNLVKLGIKIYIFVLLVVSLILIDKREESLC